MFSSTQRHSIMRSCYLRRPWRPCKCRALITDEALGQRVHTGISTQSLNGMNSARDVRDQHHLPRIVRASTSRNMSPSIDALLSPVR